MPSQKARIRSCCWPSYNWPPARSEIFRLTWADVDFANSRVRLWTRKRTGGTFDYDWLPMTGDSGKLDGLMGTAPCKGSPAGFPLPRSDRVLPGLLRQAVLVSNSPYEAVCAIGQGLRSSSSTHSPTVRFHPLQAGVWGRRVKRSANQSPHDRAISSGAWGLNESGRPLRELKASRAGNGGEVSGP